jgi:hypothetical protein
MREQEIKHEGTAREEKKWNKERNEGDKKWNTGERQEMRRNGTRREMRGTRSGTCREMCAPPCKAWPTPDMGGTL